MSSALKLSERSENQVVAVRQTRSTRKVTVGDLISAAFDVAGGDTKKATRLLGSRELSGALGRRIVLV